MRAHIWSCALMAVAMAGCTMPMEGEPAASASASLPAAQADLRSSTGAVVARSIATQAGDSIRVRLDAASLRAGTYGAHVHSVGRCDAPGFESAGPHWNPTGRAHGRDNPAGQHMGDLPNLVVGTEGSGTIEFTIPRASLSGGGGAQLLDGDGAAIVVHAAADDYRTDPSGNSGARIACGVLR